MQLKSLTFNGIRKPWLHLLAGRRKAPFAPVRRNLLFIPGKPGAHLQSSDLEPLIIEQPVGFRVNDDEHALHLRDELAAWLITDEPVPLQFDDEPGRTYYAVVQNSLEDFTRFMNFRQGTIQFLCLDPYSYGPELTATFPSDVVTLTNNGTAPADPIFELEVLQPVTLAMIQNQDDEYMMIGRPAPVDTAPFIKEELVLHDACNTLTGWVTATEVDNGYIAGNIKVENDAFVVDTVGEAISPHKWQGPSIKRSIGTTLQDFRMDVLVDLLNVGTNMTGMIEVYLLDEANKVVMKIGVEDIWRDINQVQAKFQLGEVGENRKQYYRIADHPPAWNNYSGFLRIHREGKRINPVFGLIDGAGKEVWVSSRYVYMDYEEMYLTPIAQVQIAMRIWPTTNRATMRVKDIKFWRYNEEQENEIPYIAQPGDKIVFDHATKNITINGEDRLDLKDFGARFFNFKKGKNTLIVHPSDSFNVKVKFKERYK